MRRRLHRGIGAAGLLAGDEEGVVVAQAPRQAGPVAAGRWNVRAPTVSVGVVISKVSFRWSTRPTYLRHPRKPAISASCSTPSAGPHRRSGVRPLPLTFSGSTPPNVRIDMTAPAKHVWIALVTVWVVWGSTYFGIRSRSRRCRRSSPGSSRFLMAGSVLAAALAAQDENLQITSRELLGPAVARLLLLTLGVGLVHVAERGSTQAWPR